MEVIFQIVLFVQEIYIDIGFTHSLVMTNVIIVFTYILKTVYSIISCFCMISISKLICFFFLTIFKCIILLIIILIIFIILVVNFLMFKLIIVISSCSSYNWILICCWFFVVKLRHQTYNFVFFWWNRFLILNLLILNIC